MAFYHKTAGLYYGLVETDLHRNLVGVGARAGLMKQITPSAKINLSYEGLWYEGYAAFYEDHLVVTQTVRINQNNSIRLSIMRDSVDHHETLGGQLAWDRYW